MDTLTGDDLAAEWAALFADCLPPPPLVIHQPATRRLAHLRMLIAWRHQSGDDRNETEARLIRRAIPGSLEHAPNVSNLVWECSADPCDPQHLP